jgi:hypothetical protein
VPHLTGRRGHTADWEAPTPPDLYSWQLVVSTTGGTVLVPATGLEAKPTGLEVARADGTTVRAWAWEKVASLDAGSEMPGGNGTARRMVEVSADGREHLFLCTKAALDDLRSSLRSLASLSYLDRRLYEALQDLPSVCGPEQTGLSREAQGTSPNGVGLLARPVSRLVSTVLSGTADGSSRRLRQARLDSARRWLARSPKARLAPVVAAAVAIALLAAGVFGTGGGRGTVPTVSKVVSGAGRPLVSIMEQMARQYGSVGSFALAPATTPPAPAPPSLADAPALKSHEVFAFAPYWNLPGSSSYDVADLTTLAYFSLDVNADGSIDESGPGWVGYQSQDLATLITRAHQSNDRVVLTVTCFDQRTLDALTSDPSAPQRLATQLVPLLHQKSFDGLNIDFEGKGAADQVGLDKLVAQVSGALRAADPHWQLTMDTYASSAGDQSGFYDIAGLAHSVDAFFVMAYDMDDPSRPTPTAALTGGAFNDIEAVKQYTSVVPPSEVILGVPYYGYDWPTAGPADGDAATGPPSPVSYSQIVSSLYPVYWDPTSQTAWTSYETDNQWHQIWYDDATSVALKAQLANDYHLAGVGVWALGMDGNDPSMLTALLGRAPAVKNFQAPPADLTTTSSTTTTSTTATTSPQGAGGSSKPAGGSTTPPGAPKPGSGGSPAPQGSGGSGTGGSGTGGSGTGGSGTGGSGTGSTSTTTTTIPQSAPTYSGTWDGSEVTLDTVAPNMYPPEAGSTAGQLTGFSTNDPAYTCLNSGPALSVSTVQGAPGVYMVIASKPADCANGLWEFVAPAQSAGPSASARRASATGKPQGQTSTRQSSRAPTRRRAYGGDPSLRT